METFILKQKQIQAEQYFKGKQIEGVQMSEGWKQTGNWSDRFREDPEISTPYILINNVKQFIKEGDWICHGEDGFFIRTNEKFNKLYIKL